MSALRAITLCTTACRLFVYSNRHSADDDPDHVTSFFAIVALSFVLGIRHATDPDHVIAVTTIVARQRTTTAATAIGAAWGVGHTLTILLVGGGIILFGWVIPSRLALSMELSVGLMLIVLGMMNLAHRHEPRPGGHEHAADGTPEGWLDRHFGTFAAYQLVRPFVVGVVHGLAGSAAVALLVMTTIRNPVWALLYLVVFGVGTILGMMCMTAMIALPFAHTSRRFAGLNSRLRVATGVLSVAFGIFVAYQVGFTNGLFTGHP
jgi:sulfite exporter TauE/SafE